MTTEIQESPNVQLDLESRQETPLKQSQFEKLGQEERHELLCYVIRDNGPLTVLGIATQIFGKGVSSGTRKFQYINETLEELEEHEKVDVRETGQYRKYDWNGEKTLEGVMKSPYKIYVCSDCLREAEQSDPAEAERIKEEAKYDRASMAKMHRRKSGHKSWEGRYKGMWT